MIEKWSIKPWKDVENCKWAILSGRSKGPVVTGGGVVGGEGWTGRAQRALRALKSFSWHSNARHVPSHICLPPQNVHEQEWTLMQTMSFGRLWCVSVGSPIVINRPLRWGCYKWGPLGQEGSWYVGNLCTSQFCCEFKTTLKNSLLI